MHNEKRIALGKNSEELVDVLYNSIDMTNNTKLTELKAVLLKVFKHLQAGEAPEGLLNKLVNYINFNAYTEGYYFTDEQQQIIRELTDIGNRAGVNSRYRSNYGDVSQF
ncbi:bacteriocin immunity protein [Periweissella cryptocerci]|nr:bacteriocin immunity protein [Periweissella cryptocerci]